jgi:hypothetical protein
MRAEVGAIWYSARMMTTDRVKAVLDRVSTWPNSLQEELARVVLEIEEEMGGAEYEASADELAAIGEGFRGQAASEDDVERAFAGFRRA